jgi:hypothetical protein
LKRLDASIMQPVPRIEQGHQRTCVDEDHRPNFFPSATVTPCRVSVDGAMAYPPGPKLSSR